jgi:hypothetical protein
MNTTDSVRLKRIYAPVQLHGRDDWKEDDRSNEIGENRSRHYGHQAIGVQLSIMYMLMATGRYGTEHRTYASGFES